MAAKRGKSKDADRPGPGRPPVHGEPYTKTTVVLLNRQIAALDRFAVDVRAASGTVLNRGEIIRALVDAFTAAEITPSDITSESELAELLSARLRQR